VCLRNSSETSNGSFDVELAPVADDFVPFAAVVGLDDELLRKIVEHGSAQPIVHPEQRDEVPVVDLRRDILLTLYSSATKKR
jgi:hypothetical protein